MIPLYDLPVEVQELILMIHVVVSLCSPRPEKIEMTSAQKNKLPPHAIDFLENDDVHHGQLVTHSNYIYNKWIASQLTPIDIDFDPVEHEVNRRIGDQVIRDEAIKELWRIMPQGVAKASKHELPFSSPLGVRYNVSKLFVASRTFCRLSSVSKRFRALFGPFCLRPAVFYSHGTFWKANFLNIAAELTDPKYIPPLDTVKTSRLTTTHIYTTRMHAALDKEGNLLKKVQAFPNEVLLPYFDELVVRVGNTSTGWIRPDIGLHTGMVTNIGLGSINVSAMPHSADASFVSGMFVISDNDLLRINWKVATTSLQITPSRSEPLPLCCKIIFRLRGKVSAIATSPQFYVVTRPLK